MAEYPVAEVIFFFISGVFGTEGFKLDIHGAVSFVIDVLLFVIVP